MGRKAVAACALFVLIATAVMLTGCSNFFVSPGSLQSITVTPATAYLSSTSGSGTLTITASGTAVNGNGYDTSGTTWSSSDTTGTYITLSATTGSSITVTPTSGAGGQVTVTASLSGQTATVYIDETNSPEPSSNTLTINLSATIISNGSTVTASAQTANGTIIPAQYITWTVPSGANLTSENGGNAVFTFISVTTGQTATISGSTYTNGNSQLSGTSATITIE